ncbi:sperm flagellar protein 1-like isoform X6 [Mytilus californianus]|uniref:sperm flagellar protein 1-like isoform X6 n=1 Tax=Mytilus californianus TaxID=6549 RepID=UPI00224556AA|nr:sperm flagellar protein 1-like isoform X6 [Mytilus californianus]
MDMDTITFRKQLNGLTRVDMEEYFDDVEVENLYHWIDRIPLSRPKKNVVKDFSDGVLVAEIVAHYLPKWVELHNYTPAAATKQKMENWYLLNRRVLRKLDLDLSDDVIRALANTTNPKPRVIEKVLMLLRMQIDKMMEKQEALVPVTSKSTGRHSPEKISSPRKYQRGEIPHSHPDRSLFTASLNDFDGTYLGDGKQPLYEPKLFIVPSSENVSRSLLEEKEMESLAKTETIKILNSKIKRLEQLLHFKDIRVEDLQSQLSVVQGMYYVTNKRYR